MPDPSWLQSGPSELDLTKPLVQGEELGQQAAFRRAQIQQDANRQELARQALGLQAQAQQFQQNAYMAGADMRATQLDLAQQSLVAATRGNQNAASDQSKLMEIEEDFNKKAAAGDFQSIGNATPDGFSTPEAVNQFHKLQADALQTIGGQKFMAQQNQNTTTLLEANSLGIQPIRDPSGQPDFMATNAAILAKKADMAKIAAENSPSVLAETTRAASQEKIYGIKADTSLQNNINNNAEKAFNAKMMDLKNRASSGAINPQEYDILSNKLQQDYQNHLSSGGSGTLSVNGNEIPIDNVPDPNDWGNYALRGRVTNINSTLSGQAPSVISAPTVQRSEPKPETTTPTVPAPVAPTGRAAVQQQARRQVLSRNADAAEASLASAQAELKNANPRQQATINQRIQSLQKQAIQLRQQANAAQNQIDF